jgi:DDE domain
VIFVAANYGLIYAMLLGLLTEATFQTTKDLEDHIAMEPSSLSTMYRSAEAYPEPLRSVAANTDCRRSDTMDSKAVAALAKLIITASGLKDSISGTPLPMARRRSRRRDFGDCGHVKRDKAAALKLLKRVMKKFGRPRSAATGGLCSYTVAMKEIGNANRHEVGRRLNNRAENSRQPSRRERAAVSKHEDAKIQLCSCSDHNHFNQERHLVSHEIYKETLGRVSRVARSGGLKLWFWHAAMLAIGTECAVTLMVRTRPAPASIPRLGSAKMVVVMQAS